MKKEDFTAMGISEELAEKAAKASEEELKGFVPRSRLNEESQARKNAEQSLNDVKAELDKLKTTAGDSTELQSQIEKLKDELKDKEKKYADEIADMKLVNAIQAALSGSAQDAGLVAGLVDKTKLILGEDGKVTGLEEQINGLKESKPFLFKGEDGYPDVSDKGEPNNSGGKKSARDLFAEAIDGTL